jgi:hypothetical protein
MLGIQNRMTVPWNGVSYHVVFRNAGGQAVGEARGIPYKFMDPQAVIGGTTSVDASCDSIARMDVMYFGYYPANGGGQIRLRNSAIRTAVK